MRWSTSIMERVTGISVELSGGPRVSNPGEQVPRSLRSLGMKYSPVHPTTLLHQGQQAAGGLGRCRAACAVGRGRSESPGSSAGPASAASSPSSGPTVTNSAR